MMIYSYDKLDLSKCRANLDFKLLEGVEFVNGVNLQNCELRNLEYFIGPLEEEYFDSKTIAENPNLFLSDLFSKEFKRKFAQKKLKFEDLYNLSEEQYKELEEKNISSKIADVSYYIKDLIEKIGLSTILNKMLDKDLLNDISILNSSYYSDSSPVEELIKTTHDINELRQKIYDLIIDNIKNNRYSLTFSELSSSFKEKYSEYFPQDSNIPQDVISRYYNSRLTIEDIANYGKYFGNLDLSSFIEYDYQYENIIKFLGINFQRLLITYPKEMNIILNLVKKDYHISYSLDTLISNNFAIKDSKIPIEELKDSFINTVFNAQYGNSYTFSKISNSSIYDGTSYPSWIKELGYYVSKINNYLNINFDLITKETEISNPNINNMFKVLGIDNIRRFDRENPSFFNTYNSYQFEKILTTLDKIELKNLTPVTSYDEFQDRFIEIITSYKPKEDYMTNPLSQNLEYIEGSLREKHPELFISTEAPKELKVAFYDGRLTIHNIIKNPEWIPYISHLSAEQLGLNIPIHIINSDSDFPQNPQEYTFSELYLKYGSIEDLLNFLSEYNMLDNLINIAILGKVFDTNIESRKDIEKNIRSNIRKFFIKNHYNYRYSENMPIDFKEENPDFFIPEDAPQSLKWEFYNGYLGFSTLKEHPEYIDYLKNVNCKLIRNLPEVINIKQYNTEVKSISFEELYINRFGLDEFIKFLVKYSPTSERLSSQSISSKDGTKENVETELEVAIASSIIKDRTLVYNENFPDHFKNMFPHLFISKDAPTDLKDKFYNRRLSIDDLTLHPDWIPYLSNVNLSLISNLPFLIGVASTDILTFNSVQKLNFQKLYTDMYGQEEFLKYVAQYGSICMRFQTFVINLPVSSKEELDNQLDEQIYNIIIKFNHSYSEDYPKHFKERFSDLFLPPDAPSELKETFYNRKITIDFLLENPTYFKYLSNIDLSSTLMFKNFNLLSENWKIYKGDKETISLILEKISQDELLKLLSLYGKYLTDSTINLESFEGDNFENIQEKIEKDIINQAEDGTLRYDEQAPTFLKDALPNYFISPDAPDDLKDFYYGKNPYNRFSFQKIKDNEEKWLPYLKDKSLRTPINMSLSYTEKQDYIRFTTRFACVALKLGLKRTEVVEKMINAHQVDIMEEWYYKTGGKFLPDTVIMQNFSLDDADKFLSHGKEWSSLMRNKRFAKNIEGREAMLKLAYVFGVFDGDSQGSKKLDSLLNDIPKKLSENDYNKLLYMEENIQSDVSRTICIGEEAYKKLKETMISEGLNITDKSIIKILYHENGDGTYSLSINPQTYPKTRELLRQFMEENEISSILTPNKAHTMFGSFKMIYDRNFRDFLLNNLDFFQKNTEYTKYIPAIHEQFREIQIANSNRVLTPELAISFVEHNKYTSVEVGNETLAQISAIAGYSQSDFDKLQEIYNYGKTRIVSSIPRIEGTLEDYKYEMLSLTDPLAVAIGTLTDCCQELNNAAEVCMEHSMVSTHGRVFVIRDTEGNIISQSWVWRNGDVLCFDNIEIPDKAFLRAQRKENGQSRKEFTEEVYEVYKKAAQELIEQDEKIYKELLENGKITQEQYDGLRLGKITVGLGYNDIADSLKKNAIIDDGIVTRPLSFTPPVPLLHGLYTADSTTQYILEERNDRKEYIGDTPPVHYDEVKIYDYQTFGDTQYSTLKRLEIQSGRDANSMNTYLYNEETQTNIEEIATNYGINLESIKILINPNFAIVYDDSDNINIADILINKSLSNHQSEKTILQLKLAILQLQKNGKRIDLSSLDQNQIDMIDEAINISEEKLDEERGISHGTN